LALARSREAAAKVLKECQDAMVKTYGEAARFYLIFYGGSGSTQEEIHEALDYGVVKMNVDTDMQYAFTRAVAGRCSRTTRRAESGRRSRQQESL
jgi:fructose/tagatose bisphosphate aldolase